MTTGKVSTAMAQQTTGARRWLRGLGALGLVLLALAVRLPRLAERPMHTDESVNAYLVGQVLDGGRYVYDPQDRHGPALYLATLPVARAAGETSFVALRESTLRLVPVIMGVLAALLFLGLAAETGAAAAVAAALLWTLCALPVFFSRYYIHETGFTALTLGVILCSRRAAHRTSFGWAALAGLCAGLMLAFKETAVLHYAALAVTAAAAVCLHPAADVPPRPRFVSGASRFVQAWPLLVAGLGVAVLTVLLFYTRVFTDWSELGALARSLGRFTARAGGEGHAKHPVYYLLLLGRGWAGLPCLTLAALGAVWSLRLRHPAGCFFLIYCAVITLLYSAIPYKTPWLALNLWLPLGVLAGLGAAALLQAARPAVWSRAALAVGTVLFLAALGADLRARVYRDAGGEHNPYYYAHTLPDLLRLPARVAQLARTAFAGRTPTVAVVLADPWPLPWYLRQFPRVGYWQPGQDPGAADLYITGSEAEPTVQKYIAQMEPEFFGQRPNVLLILWVPAPPPAGPAAE